MVERMVVHLEKQRADYLDESSAGSLDDLMVVALDVRMADLRVQRWAASLEQKLAVGTADH